MGIFSVIRNWVLGPRRDGLSEDSVLDWCIADALSDETSAPVPPGAWMRLRMSIAERKIVRGYGMWVLDQTIHDPPEIESAISRNSNFELALYLHSNRHMSRRWMVGHPSLGGLSPTFITVFTL